MRGILTAPVLLLALALAQARVPNPSVHLQVQPENATTSGFTVKSWAYPDGAEFLGLIVRVEFLDRSGTTRREQIAYAPGPTVEVKNWKLAIPRGWDIGSKLASIRYRPYTLKDGTLHSTGEIYPGTYTFVAQAFFRYNTGRQDKEGNPIYEHISREARVTRFSLYAGLTDSSTLRDIFYYAQRLFMVKGLFEGGGTIDGPYSPSRNYWERPWIGGIFHGFRQGSILWNYFQNHGVKGYLADNGDYPPQCTWFCSAMEAYDPDWILGRDGDMTAAQAQAFLGQFLAGLVGDFTGRVGNYGYRGLSRGFSLGEYDPKGFIMFSTPHRDYLFFSRGGKFEDGEPILVIELSPGVVATLRAVMKWGDLKRQLPECTSQGCPRKSKDK